MAKGDVTFKIDANTAEFVQACIKARDAARQLGEEAGRTGDKIAAAGEKSLLSMDKLGKSMNNMAKGGLGTLNSALGIGGGIATFTQIWDSYLTLKQA